MLTKIILLGITVCGINILLKSYQKAFVLPINIVYISVVLILIFGSVSDSFKDITNLFSISGTLSKTVTSLYKCAAICILSKISVDLCKESGNVIVSDMIDLGGRIIILSIALPFISTIIKTAASFVK